MKRLFGAAALLLALTACTPDDAEPAAALDCEAGRFTQVPEAAIGDYTYTAAFQCPEADALLPTVIVLHGMPSSGAMVRGTSNMDTLAEEAGFLAVYPSNPANEWDAQAAGDDAAFLSDLIDELVAEHGADPERIYLTGFSNGGDMTLAAAVGLGDRLAGAAVVVPAGTHDTLAQVEGLQTPIPLAAFVGTSDPRTEGRAVLEAWREQGSCAAAEQTSGGGFARASWTCAGDVPMVEYQVDGGHVWFGTPGAADGIWASAEIWDFFTALE
ncbi:alpha/beta hydrolase family esterase [Glycomyces tritici]|uniref:PHB depolymerase family esterase n=1 Tax=Glycomyces tritici TaxID=2665176 RepID=A0ABT7YJZ6_9ACTN|nr:PHB depolymerase family esterase [Glycomyces tritici]MDN3238774.1 PHB depolymerase family esterase [Glycomyces tritici]